MNAIRGIVALMSVASLVIACDGGTGDAGGTVNWDPATGVDTSGPAVNLLVTRAGAADVEVQGQPGANPKKSTTFGDTAITALKDFSVLATAKDPESGIKDLKITMTRTICFTSSGGANAAAPLPTVTRKETHWADRTHAPTSPSLGETGVIDGRDTSVTHGISATNLLVWTNSQGHTDRGNGVATKWGMEATNFAGKTTYSDVIYVLAGPTNCAALP